MKTSNNLFKSCLLAWFLLSQLILAVNVKPCSVELELPDFIPANLDDDNENEEWDKDDTPMLDGDDDLKECEVSIEADPEHNGTLTVTFEEGSDKVGGVAWTDETKETEHDLNWDVEAGQLVFTETAPETFYLEGIEHSDSWDDVKLKAKLSVETEGESCTAEDEKTTTVLEIDFDVDSENTVVRSSEPPNDDLADKRENSFRIGKLVPLNTADADVDGIPDFADGFDIFSILGIENIGNEAIDDRILNYNESFTVATIEIKEPFDLQSTEICFEYSLSDPNDVKVDYSFADSLGPGRVGFREFVYLEEKLVPVPAKYTLPETGSLRIWSEKSNESRRAKSITEYGTLIPSLSIDGDEAWFPIFRLKGVEDSDRKFLVYLEGVNVSAETITVKVRDSNSKEVEDILKVGVDSPRVKTSNSGFEFAIPESKNFIRTSILNSADLVPSATYSDLKTHKMREWISKIEARVVPYTSIFAPASRQDTNGVANSMEINYGFEGFQFLVASKLVYGNSPTYSESGVRGYSSPFTSEEYRAKHTEASGGLYGSKLSVGPDEFEYRVLLPTATPEIRVWLLEVVNGMEDYAREYERAVDELIENETNYLIPGQSSMDKLDRWMGISKSTFDCDLYVKDSVSPTLSMTPSYGFPNLYTYNTVNGVVVHGSKINNALWVMFGRYWGFPEWVLRKGGAFNNNNVKGAKDPISANNAYTLGGNLYDLAEGKSDDVTMTELEGELTTSRLTGLWDPDLIEEYLWPVYGDPDSPPTLPPITPTEKWSPSASPSSKLKRALDATTD